MGSPFASAITATIPIPFDPPHEVTIGKLAARHLERAAKAFFNGMVRDVQARGGSAAQKDVERLFEKDPAQQQADADAKAEAETNPLAGLDLYWVCAAGIKAWTYPKSLKTEKVVMEDGTEEPRIAAILDLDEPGRRWFATEIMRLTRPALFQTKDEREADQKNA